MKTVFKIGLIFLGLVSVSAVSAQIQPLLTLSSFMVESGEYLNLYTGHSDDGIYLQQVGIYNQAVVTQHSDLSDDNLAEIRQFGYSESALLGQYGRGNLANIYQLGALNEVNVIEKGDLISTRIFQAGVGNSIIQQLGDSGMDYMIYQWGYGHQFHDLGFRPENPGYIIRQQGLTGMKIIIQNR